MSESKLYDFTQRKLTLRQMRGRKYLYVDRGLFSPFQTDLNKLVSLIDFQFGFVPVNVERIGSAVHARRLERI